MRRQFTFALLAVSLTGSLVAQTGFNHEDDVSGVRRGPVTSAATAGPLDAEGFRRLMERLARAWTAQDTNAALSCFAEDAVYMQPPDQQLFVGHRELAPYFGALKKGTFLRLHNIWFDAARQVGSAEFSFGTEGTLTADHGVAGAEVRGGRIRFWREYFSKGPADFQRFLAREGKSWKWTIRNYPPASP